jgi:hypothetical protein
MVLIFEQNAELICSVLLAWAIAFTCIGLATTMRPTKGDSTRTTDMALPVASTTTSSVMFKLRPKPSSPERVMSTRP